MHQCQNDTLVNQRLNVTGSGDDCPVLKLRFYYGIVIGGILLSVLALTLVRFVPSILAKIRVKPKSHYNRHTNSRSSRGSSQGGSYLIRTQEEQISMQLPLSHSGSRFEYIDMLADTPTTNRTLSESNLSTGPEVNNQNDSSSRDPLVLYEEPGDTRTRDRERSMSENSRSQTAVTRKWARSESMHQSSYVSRNSGISNQNQLVNIQRGARTRASIESMSRVGLMNQERFSSRTESTRQRRSMFDPLPNVPTETNPMDTDPQPYKPVQILITGSDPTSVELVTDEILTSRQASMENELMMESQADNRVSCSPSKEQFFEDGESYLGSNVPPFCDPEIHEETGEQHRRVDLSIYSSQILRNIETSDHEEDDANLKKSVNNITDKIGPEADLYDKLNHPTHSQPQLPVSIRLELENQTEGAAAVYSRLNSKENSSNVEALYDNPIVVANTKIDNQVEVHLKDITDPKHLFDDPGYTEGMLAAMDKRERSNTHAYQNITIVGNIQTGIHSEETSQIMEAPAVAIDIEKTNTLALQVSKEPVMKLSVSSLSVLDYEQQELNDLDPDIASCLMGSEEHISFV